MVKLSAIPFQVAYGAPRGVQPEPQSSDATSQRIPEAVAPGPGGMHCDPSVQEFCGEGTNLPHWRQRLQTLPSLVFALGTCKILPQLQAKGPPIQTLRAPLHIAN